MATIKFFVTQEKFEAMTLGEVIVLSGGDPDESPDFIGMRNVIARFVVDEAGAPLEVKEARAIVARMDKESREQAVEELSKAMRLFVVPKTNGTSST